MSHSTAPEQIYELIGRTIDLLRAKNLDAAPLERVQTTAYTSSSEWLGDLGQAVRGMKELGVSDPEIADSLERLLGASRGAWPKL